MLARNQALLIKPTTNLNTIYPPSEQPPSQYLAWKLRFIKTPQSETREFMSVNWS